jgi:hypothetical protein
MPTNQLYDTVFRKLRQLRLGERVTRLRNLAWMMTGIFKSRSVHLSQIALQIPGPAVQLSIVKRLHRFLNNPALDVRSWYEPIACTLLASMGSTVGEIRLLMDATRIGPAAQWLTISVAFQHRAIPIAWTWLQGVKGHSSAKVQLELLHYVYTLLPPEKPVFLAGDTEFEDGNVQKQLNKWHWHYVLRQKSNNQVQVQAQAEWRSFGSLVSHPGDSAWVEQGRLTAKHKLSANLLAYWRLGEEDPWLLATNLPSQAATLKVYRRRMWIEEMHGDLKAHGFFLEDSHLRSPQRLSRLTLAVVLLYVWLVCHGAQVIKNGERHLVDRHDRRDLSVFQIGFRSIQRRLHSLKVQLLASFPPAIFKLSGS